MSRELRRPLGLSLLIASFFVAATASAQGSDTSSLIDTLDVLPGSVDLGLVRVIAGAVLVALPWVWILGLGLLRRRRHAAFVRAANRSLAVSTLFVVLEVLALVFVVSYLGAEVLLTPDALYLLGLPYLFGVLLVMLGVLDKGGELASRRLIATGTKWGLISTVALGLANAAVAIFWPAVAVFAIPISIALLGVLGSVFLIRLWRSGDRAAVEGPAKPATEATSELTAEETSKLATEATSEPATKERSKPARRVAVVAEPVVAEAPPTARVEPPQIRMPPEVIETKNSASSLSDDQLAAAFEAMESGGQAAEEVPEDREDLYALLGQLNKRG